MNDMIYNSVFSGVKKKVTESTEIVEQDKLQRFMSDGQVNTVKETMAIIKKILDICMSNKNISFVDENNTSEGQLPSISYSLIKRDKSSKTPIKDKLIAEIKEVVDGKETGDVFQIFLTVYDCLVEFNFYDNNTNEIDEIKHEFESIIEMYTGDLKLAGVSEMYFLEEITPKVSTQKEHNPKATMVYYIELQRLKTIRLSSIKTISSQIKNIVSEESSIADILSALTENNQLI